MRRSRTSLSHPLEINSVAVCEGCGCIGLTFCPGKKQKDAASGSWNRDFNADMDAVRTFGAKALVTLMPDEELQALSVPAELFRTGTAEFGIEWYQLPICDGGIPDRHFEELWVDAGSRLRALLKKGSNIVIHCKGGQGRTGTIAARLLIEIGVDAKTAIQTVRHARPGAIENVQQEQYVHILSAK